MAQVPNMYYKTLSNEDAKPFQLTATGPKKTKVAENPSKESAAADERVEAADERVEVPVYDSDNEYEDECTSVVDLIIGKWVKVFYERHPYLGIVLEKGIEPDTKVPVQCLNSPYKVSNITQSLENERMSVWYKQVYACKNVPNDGRKIKYKVQ